MEVNEKTALITGASSGMGMAIVDAFVNAKARVILLARRKDLLDRIADKINSNGGAAFVYSIDLSDTQAIEEITNKIKTELGVPDIIINNAGSGQWKFIDETSAEEAVQMMTLPYFATFCITKAFLPEMLKRNSGHIVNISSVASRFVWPGATAYIAARWAIRGFTEALRADLDNTNIGVTLYESGLVDSPYWENNPNSRERIPKLANLIPTLTTEQVGKAIVNGVRKNKKLVVIPLMMKITYWQHAVVPWAVQWLMTKTGYKR